MFPCLEATATFFSFGPLSAVSTFCGGCNRTVVAILVEPNRSFHLTAGHCVKLPLPGLSVDNCGLKSVQYGVRFIMQTRIYTTRSRMQCMPKASVRGLCPVSSIRPRLCFPQCTARRPLHIVSAAGVAHPGEVSRFKGLLLFQYDCVVFHAWVLYVDMHTPCYDRLNIHA